MELHAALTILDDILGPIALCTALLLAQIPSRAAFDAAIAAGDERG